MTRLAWAAAALLLTTCTCTPTGGSGKKKGGGGSQSGSSSGGGAVGGGPPSYAGAGTGTHYWIDGATGNDGGPGASASPWRTLDKLENVTLAPGDLVHVQAGTYDVSGSLRLAGITGSANGWIGIQAEGAVTIRNSALQNVINIEGCHYLFLKGFQITHDNGGAAYGAWDPVDGIKFQTASSDNVAIDSCRIYDIGNVGIGSQAPEIRFVTVYNCEIENCYTGIYWGYYEDPDKKYAHYGRIANNYIHGCPPQDLDGTGYGIQIKGGSRGNVIEDNVLVNVGGGTRAGIAVYHASTNLASASDRNIVRRNFLRAARNEGIYASEGALVENNILFDAGNYGMVFTPRDTGGWGVFYGNLTIRHNTVYRTLSASGVGIYLDGAGFAPPIEFANNLLLVSGGNRIALQGPGGFSGTAAKNFCHGPVSGSNLGVVSLPDQSSVQSLTYGATNFLYPTSGGILVNGGNAAFGPAQDFNHTSRSGVPDAGAYEASTSTNPNGPLTDGFK